MEFCPDNENEANVTNVTSSDTSDDVKKLQNISHLFQSALNTLSLLFDEVLMLHRRDCLLICMGWVCKEQILPVLFSL